MVAPGLAHDRTTRWGSRYDPPGGSKVGAAALKANVALVSALSIIPAAVAIARIVAGCAKWIGAAYSVDEGVGVLPSVV
jgi:hypothetical protein